jgi:hypothetical protein
MLKRSRGPAATPAGAKGRRHAGDGTEVVTSAGAIAILVFSNGATINVAEDSTLDIDQFEQDPFRGRT